jgi:hypothetical protein
MEMVTRRGRERQIGSRMSRDKGSVAANVEIASPSVILRQAICA